MPPPPPMSAEMFMHAMLGSQRSTEEAQRNFEALLRDMARNLRPGNGQRQEVGDVQYNNFRDFQHTQPPIFKEAAEPLDAEEWICTMEEKFRLL